MSVDQSWAATARPVKLQLSAGIVKAPPIDAAPASVPDQRAWLTDAAVGAQVELGGLSLGAGYRIELCQVDWWTDGELMPGRPSVVLDHGGGLDDEAAARLLTDLTLVVDSL